jgi:aspartyl-tRNA(Asn)/glutamyl-tRNA(Gln) amidotransferase subunit C
MSVSRDDVRHIAGLARLGLDESRLDDVVRELNSILGHMHELSGVDTTGVSDDETAARGHMPLRPDDGEQLKLERAREDFAPSTRDGFLIVPRLATHEDEVEE